MSEERFDKETSASVADRPEDDGGLRDLPSEPKRDSSPKQAADETTGASPGTAQACDDLGLNSLKANLAKFDIKPPGVS